MGYWLTLDNVGIFYMILVRIKGFYGKILHWKPQSNYGKKKLCLPVSIFPQTNPLIVPGLSNWGCRTACTVEPGWSMGIQWLSIENRGWIILGI